MNEIQTNEAAANGALALLVAAYFFPTIVAVLRRHPYDGAIFVVNLFLGWTFVGWVIALAWSVFPVQRRTRPACTAAQSGPPNYAVRTGGNASAALRTQPEPGERLAGYFNEAPKDWSLAD